MMEIVIVIISIIAYLVIGRITAEKRWDWDGYNSYAIDQGIILTTLFWPIYLMWRGITVLASIFIDID
ncbi:MAG: hypothetical protein ACOC2U_00105 [bacterium]